MTVQQYRADVDTLVRLAHRDLQGLWLDVADGVVARELLAEILPELGEVYGSAAGSMAADWYDELRETAQIAGRFRAIVATLPDMGRYEALAGWAVEPLFAAAPDHVGAFDRAAGGLQRVIADSGRSTVMGSAIADPKAAGWQRSASGGCAFCRMLASRGAVYSKASVNFGAHDNCRCSAVPAFRGRPIPVEPYEPTDRDITDYDRDRTRKWMSENGY